MVSGDKSEMFKKVQMLTLKEGIKKMKNVNESGRSMVEMLGVLAIIGVLSIGGIAGYTLAMNRYRANEILNTASIVAIEAIARGDANNALTNANLNIQNPTGTSGISSTSAGVVTITFDAVGKGAISGLVGDLSGQRVVGTCNKESDSCQLNMRNDVRSN